MKFLHLADLHLGKSLHGVSLIDQRDQTVWAERFLEKVREIEPDAVVVAGDIYDRSSPAADAVSLLNYLLTSLEEQKIPVLMIAGNHDCGQKLSFADTILSRQGIHISGILQKELTKVTLEDEYGPVNFWLMPYLFPALVAQKLKDDSIRDYQTAAKSLLEKQNLNFHERNVCVAHQNVTVNGIEVEPGGSETMVGGVGQIDYSVFDGFDYVALGHIHRSYPVGRETVRYAGSPLCYHFEETKQREKGPILVTLGDKNTEVKVEVLTIEPLHPMREIKDTYEKVKAELEEHPVFREYLRIVLTDQRITPQISDYFRTLLKGRNSILMELLSEYQEYQFRSAEGKIPDQKEKLVEELFFEFYSERKNGEVCEKEEAEILEYVGNLMRRPGFSLKKEPDQKDVERLLQFVLGQEECV